MREVHVVIEAGEDEIDALAHAFAAFANILRGQRGELIRSVFVMLLERFHARQKIGTLPDPRAVFAQLRDLRAELVELLLRAAPVSVRIIAEIRFRLLPRLTRGACNGIRRAFRGGFGRFDGIGSALFQPLGFLC